MPGTFAYASATNTVTVTGGTVGLPADFASFVAADRAGTGTSLLAAWGPNSNTKTLTYQVRPVELRALIISFTVAGKSAETDYIYVTGTDAWGNAQTESLNVSAGNGTYVSTKRWRTITNIDCSDNPAGGGTVWADGTVSVTQPIWGVIWDKGGFQYQLDCKWYVGDGSTATYFGDSFKDIVLSDNVGTANNDPRIYIKTNAVFRLGILISDTYYTGRNGCSIRFLESHYYLNNLQVLGTAYFYDCSFAVSGYNGRASVHDNGSGTIYLYGCLFTDFISPTLRSSTSRIVRTSKFGAGSLDNGIETGGALIKDVVVSNVSSIQSCASYIEVTAQGVVGTQATTYEIYNYDGRKNRWFVDCLFERDIWRISWNPSAIGGSLYRQNTFSLHVTDKDGVDIVGATVNLYDNNGDPVWTEDSVTTDANGTITFNGIGNHVSTINNAVTHARYYYSGGAQTESYNNFTLIITKEGYQNYQDVIVIDRKMDLEVALSEVPPPVYVNVPSGEVEVRVTAPALLGVALAADELKVQLKEG